MVSRTTKNDHPHCSFGSKASKEDDEPTLEVLGVWTSLPIWKEAARAQSCQARLGVPVHAEGMRQVARSPKRSSHEDSDVQRDVNIRVHEGAIDSVAMGIIMFK